MRGPQVEAAGLVEHSANIKKKTKKERKKKMSEKRQTQDPEAYTAVWLHSYEAELVEGSRSG